LVNAKCRKRPRLEFEALLKTERLTRMGYVQLREIFLRRRWSILSWGSGAIAMAFTIYYGLQATTNPQIGIQFVLAEWPDPSISPYFYAKPITWFMIFSFLYWTFGLESYRERFLRMSPKTRRFLFISTATIAFGAFYEIFFNFMLWSALMVLTQTCPIAPCNPDLVANSFPALRNPVNLVFATKIVTTVFGLSVYSLWYLHRIEKDLDRDQSSPRPR